MQCENIPNQHRFLRQSYTAYRKEGQKTVLHIRNECNSHRSCVHYVFLTSLPLSKYTIISRFHFECAMTNVKKQNFIR